MGKGGKAKEAKAKSKEGKIDDETVLAEPVAPGDASIWVEKRIGKALDKIDVVGEQNEIAPEVVPDGKAPEPPPSKLPKKGVEIKLSRPAALPHPEGGAVKLLQPEEKKEAKKQEKKEEKKQDDEATVLTEASLAGETSIFVETVIGKPGDAIMVDGEVNEIAPVLDAKDGKAPPVPPGKKGVEIKLLLPLTGNHNEGGPVKIVKEEKKAEKKNEKKEEKKEE